MQCIDRLPDFALRLGRPVRLARSDKPAALATLTPGERAKAHALRAGPVRDDWLRGRAALKPLVCGDTAGLTFPNPSVSVTHADGTAFAARAECGVAGIGVDYEPWRTDVRPRMAAFFLTTEERSAVAGPTALVRLWTIKEALFKAYPDNRQSVLLDFVLADADADCGVATGPGGRTLVYATENVGRGCLSVALTPLRGR